MTFDEILAQIQDLLQREQRISYRGLKRRFDLDDEYLEDLKEELIGAKRLAVDEDGRFLVWTGDSRSRVQRLELATKEPALSPQTLDPRPAAAERRQLTVMFVDLVGSTALSAQLDPEDYHAVVQQYHQTCDAVIQRYGGFVPQHLGDGVLAYFGYPTAHEDDAQQAVRAGMEIIQALQSRARQQAARAPLPHGRGSEALPVRIGIHTGLVVVGDIGAPGRVEQLALGETPNVAARIQGLTEPNTVMVSAVTHQLVKDTFECQPFGSHLVKGLDTPIAVYHVQSERHQVSPLAGRGTLTPLIGRDQEVGLLIDRWEQTKEGRGQVVLLSGEPGIGKSRLAYRLREQVTSEGSLLFEARCSPYYQQSALYPLIDVWQRTLLFTRQDTDAEKIAKLEQALVLYEMPETLPFFTALLSLPTLTTSSPLTLTPQKQKERTLQALLQSLLAQAERQATAVVWEDVHWADPSSLEFLSLLIEQIPTTKLLLVLTFRPEFTPPWPPRSHLSHLMLNRLGQKQVEAMIAEVAAGTPLPAEMFERIRVKTDGVPLFVEELTKSVIEAGDQETGNGEQRERTVRTLAIPATLQDTLMARLDRLSDARPVAQLGATLGREFSYELLHAVSPLNAAELQTALSKLVEAEILYQRGTGDHARYFFKHALIQDTAYQSLLKSIRQRYHTQIAQALEERFADTKETQPELLAHHYTEAGLIEQAIPYWQWAGQKAAERLANQEAIRHLTKGLELLKTLPNTLEHLQQELTLRMTTGAPLIATKGYTAEEVRQVYDRVRELCKHLGNTPQLFPSLWGLALYYTNTGDNCTSYELAQECLQIAQREQDSTLLLLAHSLLGGVSHWFGQFVESQFHLKRAIEVYDLSQHRSLAMRYGIDPNVVSLGYASLNSWLLGYPEQSRTKAYETLAAAQKLEHPFCHAFALSYVSLIHLLRREDAFAYQAATRLLTLAREQAFQHYIGFGTLFQGFAIVKSERREEGLHSILEGRQIHKTLGTAGGRSVGLAFLLEAYVELGHIEEGLNLVENWIVTAEANDDHQSEAELYRLKGELTLQKEFDVQGSTFKVENPQSAFHNQQLETEAEACFLKAIEIAQKQQAKSWELRASTSLARLWRRQGKQAEAHNLLANVYNWFTEGFDTKDLQEAKALLEELSTT